MVVSAAPSGDAIIPPEVSPAPSEVSIYKSTPPVLVSLDSYWDNLNQFQFLDNKEFKSVFEIR